MAKLEPGGAQLSMLRVMAELRGRGIASELLCGWASAEGVELARRHGVEPEVWGEGGNLQWTPDPALRRLAGAAAGETRADPRAHVRRVVGGGARRAGAATPLVASEHNQYLWPDRPYGVEMRDGARPRRRLLRPRAERPRDGARARPGAGSAAQPGISPVVGTQDRPLAGLPSPRIVFAGRLHADKGPDILIDAIGLLRDPPATLILGEGHLRPILEDQVRELGLEARVRFLGWVPNPGSYIAGASVLAIPSRDESFSQTAIIGLAHGVPVIGTDVDGFPATLGDGRGIDRPAGGPARAGRRRSRWCSTRSCRVRRAATRLHGRLRARPRRRRLRGDVPHLLSPDPRSRLIA